MTGIPAIVKDNSGNDHVFIRQSSNATLLTLALTTATGTWSGVTSYGGTWRSYPTALTGAGGTVWVFVLGTGGHAFLKQLSTNGTWNSWSNLGGTFTGQLGFAEDSTDMFYLNARGTSGDLEECSPSRAWPRTSEWSGGTWLAGPGWTCGLRSLMMRLLLRCRQGTNILAGGAGARPAG